MAVKHTNSAFKIKVGGVNTTLGTVPEPGAIVFHRNLAQMFYADGFNWIPLQEEIDSVAVQFITEQLYELSTGVPQVFSMIETELYNIGTSFTVSEPGQSITILGAGDYQINVSCDMVADSNNATANLAAVVNGTPLDGSHQALPRNGVWTTFTSSYPLTFEANDVLTAQIQVNGNDDVGVRNFTLGIQKIV